MNDRVYIVDDNKSTQQLTIESCTEDDAGVWKCVAENENGQMMSQCRMNIAPQSPPPQPQPPTFTRQPPTELQLYENDELMFEFEVHGDPTPSVEVTRNNEPLDTTYTTYTLTGRPMAY